MAVYQLATAIKRSFNNEFLLVRQTPPPAPEGDEYSRINDSNLWDLPSAPLMALKVDRLPKEVTVVDDYLDNKLDLSMFDVNSSLAQIASQLGKQPAIVENWSVLKYVEEVEFGPDSPVKTWFILGKLAHDDDEFSDSCKWMSKHDAASFLLQSGDRIGLLAITGLFHNSDGVRNRQLPQTFLNRIQEYPPGIMVIPMRSRTQKPFQTTNLVVIIADNESTESENSDIIKYGDALLIDPGCSVEYHSDLEELVTSLPRKLLVFLTHHHCDHIDGLSVIDKCNPNAILLSHENTFRRINKGSWSHKWIAVAGGEKIEIGEHKLEVVFAPGHTDSHTALLHLNTNSLIVGDHCVGQGSSVLDAQSGGNLRDYFQTTYKFLGISPSVLIPMHGRVSLWPKKMLSGYLKHRRDREELILKAIKNGGESVCDIVADVYANVDVKLWPAAASNVKIHVHHLAFKGMLPKNFFLEDFDLSFDDFIKKNSDLNN